MLQSLVFKRSLASTSIQSVIKSPGAAPYFLGAFGLTPFIGSAVGMLYFPSSIDQLLYLESIYGCSILSFLGAVHWGLAMTDQSSKRFVMSVIPSLIGFSSCLLPHLPVTLMIQGTTFVGLYAYERKLYKAQKLPKWYLRLRFGLTAGVVTSLVSSVALDYLQLPQGGLIIVKQEMLSKSHIIMSLSFIITANAFLQKREDINIKEPDKWFNNKMFLVVAGATCVALLAIVGPLIAMYVYKRRKGQQNEDQEDLNTVFKSSSARAKSGRNPRVSSMMLDDKRLSEASGSGYSYTFPLGEFSKQQYGQDLQVQGPLEPTYSAMFRDSFINGSLNQPSIMANDSSIPPPYDKISINKTYIIVRPYSATELDEMSVNEGDIIIVHKIYEDGWVLCMNHRNKNQGVIPSDCFDF